MAVVKVRGKSEDARREAAERALRLIDFSSQSKVFLKPNVCAPVRGNSGIVADPASVRALVAALRKLGAKEFIIGEDVTPGGDTRRCLEAAGYFALQNEPGVKILCLENEPRNLFPWRFGEIALPTYVHNPEFTYVNIPSIKTHFNTVITCALKNQKGLLDGATKKKFHIKHNLHTAIAELASVVSPALAFVDAVVGLEGDGPGTLGTPKPLGLFVAGKNQVEVDAVCARIMGIAPEEVKHLALAAEKGLGSLAPEIVGEPLERCRSDFRRATPDIIRKFNMRIHCADDGCSACNKAIADALRKMIKNPRYLPYAFFHGFLGRLDFIVGKSAPIPKNHGVLLCVGNCTRERALAENLPYVEGCPPTAEDILNTLFRRQNG